VCWKRSQWSGSVEMQRSPLPQNGRVPSISGSTSGSSPVVPVVEVADPPDVETWLAGSLLFERILIGLKWKRERGLFGSRGLVVVGAEAEEEIAEDCWMFGTEDEEVAGSRCECGDGGGDEEDVEG
jgi:hypothetical protein